MRDRQRYLLSDYHKELIHAIYSKTTKFHVLKRRLNTIENHMGATEAVP